MQVSSRWLQFAACCFLLLNVPFASLGAVASEPAVAASFDCNNTVGVDTEIICSDPLLRHADSELARLYHSLTSDGTGQAHIDALKNDERLWILRRNSQCKVSKSLKLNSDQLPNYVDCFLAAYDERMDDLRRIRANPQADPSAISNPIRKSTFGDSVAEIPIPAGALVETGLVTSDSSRPMLGFRSDNSLVVLGSKAEQPELALFVWKSGQVQETITADAPIPPTSMLCVTSKSIVVLSSGMDALVRSATQGKLQATARGYLPADVQRACAIATDHNLVGNSDGSFALDLGPRRASAADSPRFVTVVDPQGSHALTPPIRIDRRFPPRAYFHASDGKFVVSQGPMPQDARTIADHNWAKTDCGTFWLVDPATRHTSTGCIPFGSYADETNDDLVVPLPTHAGLFFAIPSSGLFKVVDGTAKRIVAAPVRQVHIAPDDCTIAFIGSPGKFSSQHRVMLLDACAVQ